MSAQVSSPLVVEAARIMVMACNCGLQSANSTLSASPIKSLVMIRQNGNSPSLLVATFESPLSICTGLEIEDPSIQVALRLIGGRHLVTDNILGLWGSRMALSPKSRPFRSSNTAIVGMDELLVVLRDFSQNPMFD